MRVQIVSTSQCFSLIDTACLSFLIENFPLLKVNITKLTQEESDELLFRLNDESKTIRSSYARLVVRTQVHLRRSDTTAEDLQLLFSECGMDELADQIDPADTIPVILSKVKRGKYWSFFNYELLADIINSLCKETPLVAELASYISDFAIYCRRRVSEVPRGSLSGEHIDKQSPPVFKIKLDDTFDIQECSLKRIKDIQYQLQKILKRKVILVNVESGCIELTFRYFSNVRLLPMEETQRAALIEIGVQWLRCGKDEVVLKTIPSAAIASVPTYGHTPPQQPCSNLPEDTARGNLILKQRVLQHYVAEGSD